MLFNTLYLIINFAVPVVLILGGLILLFVKTPDIPTLDSYRMARRAVAYAYLIFGAFCGVEIICNNDSSPNMLAAAVISLLVASSQSFLFTYALIVLIDVKYFTRRILRIHVFLIAIFITLSVISLFFGDPILSFVFYIFLIFYIWQLFYYTYLFISKYRQYKKDVNNYFSGDEERRLNWVVIAFFSALSVGTVVLILIIHTTPLLSLFVTIFCGLFYSFFLVKYINYPETFNILVNFISEPIDTHEEGRQPFEVEKLEELLSLWVSQKEYNHNEITITSLARHLGTNRTYLSSYINKDKNMNFNAWVNSLRIGDAKTLLVSDDVSIAELAEKVGYNDHSTFSRQFKKQTGYSPLEWRKNHS